jgi:bacillithiol system protein YtxJ
MSVYNKIFGNSDSKDTSRPGINWNSLTEIQQLNTIIEESAETPVILFKHSTRCSVSRMALRNFESEYSIEEGSAKPYFLDLIAHRDVSNEIASRFGVTHQSPQVIVVKNGKAVYNTSHDSIDAGVVKGKI